MTTIHARVRLLGTFRLTPGPAPQAAPIPLSTPDLQLLLAYLALHSDHAIDRDRLAFTLWPDLSEADALRYLRQNLHRLRRAFTDHHLPDPVATVGRQLHVAPGLWVDANQFRAHLTDQAHLAIDLYEGDLLPAYHEPWLETIRVELREAMLRVLRRQISVAMMRRSYRRALTYAQRLIAIGPLRESSHRIYMEALTFNNRRADALHHYQWLTDHLRQSLGVDPMPETAALADAIAQGTITPDFPPAARNPARPLAALVGISRSFVGRRQMLARIDEAFAHAINGRGAFVVVHGTDGLGKSRLLATWREARRDSIHLIDPHHPTADWDTLPPRLQALRTMDDPPVNLVGQFILTLAARSGQVVGLTLDDLHTADQWTLHLVAFVANRAARLPLFLLATLNPERLPPEARRVLHTLERARHLTTLTLPPLTMSQLAALTDVHYPQAPPGFVRHLHRVSEGNPFVAVAYLKARHLDSPPPEVAAWVAQRFGGLSPAACAVAEAAAREGRHITFDALHLPAETRITGFDELLQRGIMREFGEGYTFTHEQFFRQAH